MEFLSVANNLRDSFRILATGRPRADVMEMPGISLASLGVEFQMFNAAFLSAPVETEDELQQLLAAAKDHFSARGMAWSFWFCEDWLSRKVRRKLSQICLGYRLRLAAEMPGMVAAAAEPSDRKRTPELDMRRVESIHTLAHFQAIGSTCFHVPIRWFSEVFNEDLDSRREFVCWVGYRDGVPVATAASVVSSKAPPST